jgi:dihydroflavonol-4-reductase
VAQAMIEALRRGKHKEKYILGGRFTTMENLLKTLEKVTGVRGPKLHLPYAFVMVYAGTLELYGRITGKGVLVTRDGVRLIHAKHNVTSAKAERELGANFRPLEDTLRDTVEWYRVNPKPV